MRRAAVVAVAALLAPPLAYNPRDEFYLVTPSRAFYILNAWNIKSAAAEARASWPAHYNAPPLIIAWDPEFLGPERVPEAVLYADATNDARAPQKCWQVCNVFRNPYSCRTAANVHAQQPFRLLHGLRDFARDANATLNFSSIAAKEPVLWLESCFAN